MRLFNPTRNRGHADRRSLGFDMGLARFNRGMHGKLRVVVARLAIVGGRTLDDTWFGGLEAENRSSIDADMLLVGPKVNAVVSLFDG